MTIERHPDRQVLPRWMAGALVVGLATAMGAAGAIVSSVNGRTPLVGVGAGIVVTLLAVGLLPSVSVRLVARIALLFSGATMARFATLGPALENGTQTFLLWTAAAAAVLVLVGRLDHLVVPEARPAAGRSLQSASAGSWRRTAAQTVLVVGVTVAVVTLLAPYAVDRAGRGAASGQGPTAPPTGGSSPLRSSALLDMTVRPELTDEVVLTVRADHDLFLRGDVYDRWDGRRWTRARQDRYALVGGERIVPAPHDLAASGSELIDQTVRVEAGYADVFFAAPSAVHLDARVDAVQTLDGTLLTRRSAMGSGETYRVTSRRVPLDEEVLRAVDANPVPDLVTAEFAAPPATSRRVEALARRIVDDAGAATTYDRVRALEDWMDDNLEYSVDAPTAPEGVDVVDDFLFRAKVGWCEQIASSLVVMARSQGIPARLATGYVMGERDPVSGTYVVRARHAHAWAEVWFPDVGWVPFDPTAGVPLAPTTPSRSTVADWLVRHLVQVLAAIGVAVVAGVAGARVLARRRGRRRERDRSWADRADRRLTVLGQAAGVDRRPGDTATAYARRLGDLASVGVVIDDHRYGPEEPSPSRRREADEALAAAEAPQPDKTATVRD